MKQKKTHLPEKFLLGNSETRGHKGNLACRLGVSVTNTRVNILKVINPRLSS